MLDLSCIIDRIEYSMDDTDGVYYLEDQRETDGTKLIIDFVHCMKLFNCNIEFGDRAIMIEEINTAVRYKITFDFSKLDVATGECEYTYDVQYDNIVIESMSSHEELEDLVASKIDNSGIFDGTYKLEDLTFKPVLKKLQ